MLSLRLYIKAYLYKIANVINYKYGMFSDINYYFSRAYSGFHKKLEENQLNSHRINIQTVPEETIRLCR